METNKGLNRSRKSNLTKIHKKGQKQSMNDMIEKLRAVLAELGVEPEKIEAAIAALSEEPAPVSPEGEGEDPSTSSEEPIPEVPADDVPPVVEEVPVEALSEEAPAAPESVPQEEVPSEEVPPVEVPAEEPQPEVPAAMPELPPMVSIEEFNAVKSDLEETKKALEGLKAANDSLKEALTQAGVIDGASATEVGIDRPSAPGHSNISTTMDDILAEINRKGY